MLATWFDSPLRIRALRDGPSGPQIQGFAQELFRAGYARITARRHLRAAEHFVYWSSKEGVGDRPVDERVIQRFDRHMSRCRCPGYGHTHHADLLRGARLFSGFLRGEGLSVARPAKPQAHDAVLLAAFCQWMRQQRGTADATLYNYKRSLRDLLARVDEDPGALDAERLRRFVLETSQKSGWAATKKCTTALRMFLRFLIAEGRCAAELGAAVPTIAHWRLSALPRYLQSEEVDRLIASCDRTSAVGRRDRAILLLLAHLGLRAGDIVQLRLEDIDWKGAWLSVTGKNRRETRLPLTQEVGQALVDYLLEGRPRTDSDALFVRARAPFRAFANHCAVSVIVERALHRSGVKCPSRGAAHVLRHSAATSMLRHGASLQDIAAVLRHRSIDTTQIYAKVDVTTLGQIAQPWPGAQPC